jgi:hypothetical protein
VEEGGLSHRARFEIGSPPIGRVALRTFVVDRLTRRRDPIEMTLPIFYCSCQTPPGPLTQERGGKPARCCFS